MDCPAPNPQAPSSTPEIATPNAKRTLEKSRAAQQPEGVVSQWLLLEEEEATAAMKYHLVVDDSEDNIAENPMVSEPISPFVLPVTLTSPPDRATEGIPGSH